MRRILMLGFVLIFSIALVACGDKTEDTNEGAIDGSQIEVDPKDVEVTDEEKVDEEEIVVSINGNEVMGDSYNGLYAQTKSILAHQGQDTSDQEVLKDHVMNAIIEREILIDEAKKAGIEISDDKVEEFKEENKERYEAVLDQYKLAEAEYDKQLAFELLLEEYIEDMFPISEVSDEEIEKLYDEAKETTESLPELEEVEDQLREMYVMQQISEQMQEWKEAAEIEEYL